MYTLVDFVTHVKNVEYLLSVAAIGAFLIFWEILKPKPFHTPIAAEKADAEFVRENGGFGYVMKTAGKIVAAPFVGLAYIVMLPIGFFAVLAGAVVSLAVKAVAAVAGKSVTFEWRPVEAYFAGRKKKAGKTEPRKDEKR